jgi:hypothetical protein
MKNIVTTLVICTLLFAGVLYAATSPLPSNFTAQPAIVSEGALSISSCTSSEFCNTSYDASLVQGDGGPQPVCAPGKNCNNDQFQLRAGDGGPQPVCAPGKNCNNDQFQLRAGDGGPQPLCAPGKNCNNDQFQLRAGDGGPQPVCALGKNCNNDQQGQLLEL